MLKTLCSALMLTVADFGMAWAAPLPPLLPDAKPSIVLVANGCGPGFFRTIDGECVPNGRVLVGPGREVILPPPCPRGFRRDPDPRRRLCYRVY